MGTDSQAVRVSDKRISIDKTIPEKIETVEYDYEFLLAQRFRVQRELDDYTEARNKELAELNDLIAQAESLGCRTELTEAQLMGEAL